MSFNHCSSLLCKSIGRQTNGSLACTGDDSRHRSPRPEGMREEGIELKAAEYHLLRYHGRCTSLRSAIKIETMN
jgi:hypothetical protein